MGRIIYSIEEIDCKKIVYIGYSTQKLRHNLSKFVYHEPVDRRKKTALLEFLKQNGVEGYDKESLSLVDKKNRPLYSFKILKEYGNDKDNDFFRAEKKRFIKSLNPLYGRGKNTEKSRITVRKYTKSELNIENIRQQKDLCNLKPRQLFDLNIKRPSMDVVWKIYNENFLKEPYNIIEAITKKRILEVSEVYFDRLYKTGSNPSLRYVVSNILYLSLPFLSEQRIIEVCETYLGKITATSLTSNRENLKLSRGIRSNTYQHYFNLLKRDFPEPEERYEILGRIFNVLPDTVKRYKDH